MLIMARRNQEAIVINGDITVKVLSVRDGEVKLGVDAPKDVRVDREEVHIRRLNEKKAG